MGRFTGLFLASNMILNILSPQAGTGVVSLPKPRYSGPVALEEALKKRRSVREYGTQELTLGEISQLLWAVQGLSSSSGYRTAPSAGALYPLEVYLVVGVVADLGAGIYHYRPRSHDLRLTVEGDQRSALARAALSQEMVREGVVVIVLTGVFSRTTAKYGRRGIRYVQMETGHAAQNLLLQAVTLNLGAVVVGAFDDERVGAILQLAEGEYPLSILPIGRLP